MKKDEQLYFAAMSAAILLSANKDVADWAGVTIVDPGGGRKTITFDSVVAELKAALQRDVAFPRRPWTSLSHLIISERPS